MSHQRAPSRVPRRTTYDLWDVIYLAIAGWSAWSLCAHPSVRAQSRILGIVIGLGGFTWNRWTASRLRSRVRRAAEKIMRTHRDAFGEPHEYRMVTLDEFPGLDRAFYDSVRQWFEGNGFRFVADRENLTLSKVFPHLRTALRSFISADGTVLGTAYHVSVRSPGRARNLRMVEFESELSDGSYVGTANSADSVRTPPYPGILYQRFPAATPPEALHATHDQSLAQLLAERPGVSVTVCRTVEDFIALQRRMHAVKVRHKQAIKYAGAADIEGLRGRPLTANERAVADELERMRSETGAGG